MAYGLVSEDLSYFNLSIIYRDFSSLKKEFLMTSLICDGHLQTCQCFTCNFWVNRFPVCYISRWCTPQTVFYLGSYFKPQLPKKLTLFLIFQTIIKFIMEKEDLSYFRASIFFQSSRVSTATS